MTTHPDAHPLAGTTTTLRGHSATFQVLDWWDSAARQYELRLLDPDDAVPMDSEILYGHVNDDPRFVHTTEIDGTS